ncbi:MAG: right-handed parallel beta-helix repeat-containing protein [Planctomycetota bacterium]
MFDVLKQTRAAMVVVAMLGLSPFLAPGEDRLVPSVEYPNIQAAIDECNDGDVVIVADNEEVPYTGTGNKNLDFANNLPAGQTRAITVRSASNDPALCTIDCQGTGRGFWFHTGETSESVVSGFTIRDGGMAVGAAIYCEGSSPKIINCKFELNTADNAGGAIFCTASGWPIAVSSPIIINCEFLSNKAVRPYNPPPARGGGAIYCEGTATPLLRATPVITNCTFVGNWSAGEGGAIYCETSRALITHCQIRENGTDQARGGAIYCENTDVTLMDCLIAKNEVIKDQTSRAGGGMICLSGSSAMITNCTIAENVTPAGSGGGIYCDSSSHAIITNSILWGNTTPQIDDGSGLTWAEYCDIQNGDGPPPDPPEPWFDEATCIALDPLFVERDTQDAWKGRYYLDHDLPEPPYESPCIDAGNDDVEVMGFTNTTTRTDLAPDTDEVDLGFHYAGNCNFEGGENEVPDRYEVLAGWVEDCNYNGIPDECDPDEDGDGIPDDCDGRPADALYTVETDFDAGTLINVDQPEDPLQQKRNQLQRNALADTTPMPFLAVPLLGRGTAVRVDTDAVSCTQGECVVGEFYTTPRETGAQSGEPSRTAIDLDGNSWIANRDDDSDNRGSVIQIGVVTGGTRCDASGTPNAYGDYLKAPFDYNTCIDRDGDGLIRTSVGLEQPLPWPDPMGLDNANGGVSSAEDECIRQYRRVRPTGTRFLAVDGDNDLWIGGWENANANLFVHLDTETGDELDSFDEGVGGYGGLIDCNGVIWSARDGLLRYDTTIPGGDPQTDLCTNSYGVGIDTAGYIWSTGYDENDSNPDPICKLDPSGSLQGSFPTGNGAKGIAVTPADNEIWVANSRDGTVSHLTNDGDVCETIAEGVGDHPSAIAVDANGYLWVTNRYSHSISRIIPGTDPPAPCGNGTDESYVDLEVDLGEHAEPYNYSNMTGVVTLLTTGTGTWNVVHDGGVYGAEWHLLTWNRKRESGDQCPATPIPTGTSLTVEVRAADFQAALSSLPYSEITDGWWFDGPQGRFLEIRARFKGSCPGEPFATPVLCDLSASDGIADMNCDGIVNSYDIDGFICALSPSCDYEALYPHCYRLSADCNGDGIANSYDIDCFIALVSGG